MLNPTQTPAQVINRKYSARMYCNELRTVVLDTKGIGVARGSSLDSIQHSGKLLGFKDQLHDVGDIFAK